MESPDDIASLVERAQKLDSEAFDEIVDRYSARLYGFLLRLTQRPEDAEDLVQEVFVRVVRTIGQYVHDGRFEPWLFSIAKNLARDRVRRTRHGPKVIPLDASGGSAANDKTIDRSVAPPDRALGLAEQVDRMQQALAELPQPEREVILLRHYGMMSFAEIAGVMETPLGTALARAHRGLAKLRGLIGTER